MLAKIHLNASLRGVLELKSNTYTLVIRRKIPIIEEIAEKGFNVSRVSTKFNIVILFLLIFFYYPYFFEYLKENFRSTFSLYTYIAFSFNLKNFK